MSKIRLNEASKPRFAIAGRINHPTARLDLGGHVIVNESSRHSSNDVAHRPRLPGTANVKSDPLDSPELVFKRSFVGVIPRRVSVPLAVTTLVVLGVTIVFLHDTLPSRFEDMRGLFWATFVSAWFVIIFAWRSAGQMYVYNEERWLASLPFPFDAKGYKEMLHRRSSRSRCIVVVETNAGDDKSLEHISTALRGPQVDEVLEEGAGSFAVHSIFFDTTTDSEEDSYYSNLRLHQWFKGYAKNVLSPLHAVGLVKYVRVSPHDTQRAKPHDLNG